MDRLLQVFRFELVRVGKRRAYLFMTFVVPMIAVALLFGYQAYQDYRATRAGTDNETAETGDENGDIDQIGYVDHSGLFGNPGLFGSLLTQYDNDEVALDAMRAGEVDIVYIIGEDYMETAAVTSYADTFSISNVSVDGVFRSFLLANLLRDVDQELLQRLQSDLYIVEHQVAATGETTVAQSEDSSFILVYVFGLLLAFATFFSGGYLLQGVVEEKETRMVEIILSTVRPVTLLTGKVLASGLLGLVQIAIWAGTAVFIIDRLGNVFEALSGISARPSLLLWSLLYFIAGYLFFAGGYAAIGAIAASQREGPQLAVFITLPAMLPFYFLSFFAESPHSTLAVSMSLIPITAPIAMIQRLAVTQVPAIEIIISMGLLLLAALGMVWLAGRFFRVNNLLAGQRPKLRDLVRIVREG